nr:hypothetical protein [uncultured Bacteroides sp.]
MKKSQQEIELQEKKDRSITIELFNNLFTSINTDIRDITAHTDLFLTGYTLSHNKAYNVEIKEREMYSNTFPDCYLELKKYQHLLEDNYTHSMVYLCIYKDAILIWNLSNIDMKDVTLTKRWMKKSTFNGEEMELKDVYLLPINKAKQFKINGLH